MTGFGAAEDGVGHLSARIEFRTVNHRHLLTKLRLPAECAALEPKVEAIVRKHLIRGSVSGVLSLNRSGISEGASIDADLAKSYYQQAQELAAALDLEATLSVDSLLGMPGVVKNRPAEDGLEDADSLILGLVKRALDDLITMRDHEGAALCADLRSNSRKVASELEGIAARMPVAIKEHQAKLQERVNELIGAGPSVAPGDLAREIAIMADRLDVSEEISRLEAHLKQLDQLLTDGGPVGRKLDFLVQEFLREANTIGSKCSDAEVAHHVVELKTHIERLREQVQNVE